VNGYVNPENRGRHANPLKDPNAVVNPIFRGWATACVSYEPTPQYMQPWWRDPNKALGPSMTDSDGVYTVSLGDLYQEDIDAGVPPGRITLSFSETIRNQKGDDFVVFENGFRVTESEYYCELGYVEVSSNGVDFARFPAVALMTSPDPNLHGYYYLDITDIYNLAGKHPNNGDAFTGTPFDLQEIADDPNVILGIVDINNIKYVRIVDIPGNGDFSDDAIRHIDPCAWPNWAYYSANHPIYDAWLTWGSGGLDLEAVGVLNEQEYSADVNLDGVVDMADLALFASAWRSHFGQSNWIRKCDLAEPKDFVVDGSDLAVFAEQWVAVEKWRLRSAK